MKSKTPNAPSTSSAAQNLIVRIIREGSLLLWLLACIYLLLALFSYSPQDPGWSSTGTNAIAQNTLGPTGAWIADRFLSFFGYVAYLFPLLIAYRLWKNFQQRHQPVEFDGLLLGLRTVGFLLVVLSGTGLIAIQTQEQFSVLPFSDGGLLGIAIAQAVEKALGFVGATLLFLALGLFGFTVFTDLSWLRLIDNTGRLTLVAYQKVVTTLKQGVSRYIKKKQEQRQAEAAVKLRQDSAVRQSMKMQ